MFANPKRVLYQNLCVLFAPFLKHTLYLSVSLLVFQVHSYFDTRTHSLSLSNCTLGYKHTPYMPLSLPLSHVYTHTSAHAYTRTHQVYTHIYTYIIIHTRARTHTLSLSHTHTDMHTYTHIHVHAYTLLTRTHVRAHTQTHTRTQTHSERDELLRRKGKGDNQTKYSSCYVGGVVSRVPESLVVGFWGHPESYWIPSFEYFFDNRGEATDRTISLRT